MDQNWGAQRDVEDLPGLNDRIDMSIAPNSYKFDGLQDQNHNSSATNGSLLAPGLGSTNPATSVGQQEGQISGNGSDQHIALTPKQEPCDQSCVTVPPSHDLNNCRIPTYGSPTRRSHNTWSGNSSQPLSVSNSPHMTRTRPILRNGIQSRNSFSQNTNTFKPQPQQHPQVYTQMSNLIPQLNGYHLNHLGFSTSNERTQINPTYPVYPDYHLPQVQDHRVRLPSINTQPQYPPNNFGPFPVQHSMQQAMDPRTPPQTYVPDVSPVSNHVRKSNVSTPSKVKHEMPSPRSTTRPKRKSTIAAPDETGHASSPKKAPGTGGPTSPGEDRGYIDTLISAMMDGTEAEDNDGMIKTWNKLSLNNEAKLERKAIELLDLLKEAQQQTIGDKKTVNQYDNFQTRYEALCQTLKTQKTVCKHLLEPPYSHTVANDPTYAGTRVVNNRRVNDQKKQAINVGRRIMGQRGQGKGRKVSAIPEDEQSSDDPFVSDDDSNIVDHIKPEPQSQPRRIRKTKRTHRRADDDDSDYQVSKSASKKSKRGARRSMYEFKKINGKNVMVDTSEDHGMQAMSSSPIQSNEVHYGGQHAYEPTQPTIQNRHQNNFDQNHGQQYEDYSHPYSYLSPVDPTSSPHQYQYSSGAEHPTSDDFDGHPGYCSDVDNYEGQYGTVVSYPGEYDHIPKSGY